MNKHLAVALVSIWAAWPGVSEAARPQPSVKVVQIIGPGRLVSVDARMVPGRTPKVVGTIKMVNIHPLLGYVGSTALVFKDATGAVLATQVVCRAGVEASLFGESKRTVKFAYPLSPLLAAKVNSFTVESFRSPKKNNSRRVWDELRSAW